MSSWLSRNSGPIGIVVAASILVIVGFEILDAFVGTTPTAPTTETVGDELEGAAAFAGIIKVLLFLAVGGALTLFVRSRLSRASSD